jgi:hypothetical protein
MALDDPFLLAYIRYPLKILSNEIKKTYDQRINNSGLVS